MNNVREWERWDDPGVAEKIDRLWADDPRGQEHVHRVVLGRLVKEYSSSPLDPVLEVGCGSGLIYEQLVPGVIDNSSYVGVDTSEEMLRLAGERFPVGQFSKGDLYSLQFSDNSFEIAICFEVLGHLPEILKPIEELFRVASRLFLFTIWISPGHEAMHSTEEVGGSKFLHNLYTDIEIVSTIELAAKGQAFRVETRVLSENTWAYVVFKGQEAKTAPCRRQLLPFPGYVAELIRKHELTKLEVEERERDLERLKEEHAKQRDMLKRLKEEHAKQRDMLERLKEEHAKQRDMLERLKEEHANERDALTKTLMSATAKGKLASQELDLLRSSRVIRLVGRLRDRGDSRKDVSPNFSQLLDDSFIFNTNLRGYRLQPSLNLQRMPYIEYPIQLERKNLSGILLAPIVDFTSGKGEFGIEIVSPSNKIVLQRQAPVNKINEFEPARFDFPAIEDSDQGTFRLRVFVRDAETSLRIFEWRKYGVLGFGKLHRQPFCGYVFA